LSSQFKAWWIKAGWFGAKTCPCSHFIYLTIYTAGGGEQQKKYQ